MHFLSIWNVLHFFPTGTILITHLDFLPFNGVTQPFSFFRVFFFVFLHKHFLYFFLVLCESCVQRDRKCSYRSLTCSYVKLDFFWSILFTISCKSYNHFENVSLFFISFIVSGCLLRVFVRFLRQCPQGNTCWRLNIKSRYCFFFV